MPAASKAAGREEGLARNLALLHDFARSRRTRTTACNIHDFQVARSALDWRDTLTYRTPPPDVFVRQVRYRDAGMRFTVRVNDEFVAIDVDGPFGGDILCSFGRKPAAGFSVSPTRHDALSRLVGVGVFLESGSFSSAAPDLLRRRDVQQGIRALRLTGKESLHIRSGQAALYLQRYHSDQLVAALSTLTDLLALLPRPEPDRVSLRALPPEFHHLIPLIRRWAISDDAERSERLARASAQSVKHLITAVTPHLAAINQYLDSYGEAPPPEHACALGALAECVAEARMQMRATAPTRKRA